MGISLGAMQYSGEVGQVAGNFLNPSSQPRPAITAHYGKYLGNTFMIRGSLTFGQAGAADRLIPTGVNIYKSERNFEFRSTILEMALTMEVFLLNLLGDPESDKRFRPYILGGVGFFRFNPEGKYITPGSGTIDWVPLQPLRTSGQGLVLTPGSQVAPPLYSLNSSNINFGLGFRYRLNQWFDLGIEFMDRRTNTDYFDDIGPGHYVDFSVFDAAYGPTYRAETAKYLSNFPKYNELYGGPTATGGFSFNAPRSSGVSRNDYFYTTSFKLIYFFRENGDKNLKKGIVPCPQMLNF